MYVTVHVYTYVLAHMMELEQTTVCSVLSAVRLVCICNKWCYQWSVIMDMSNTLELMAAFVSTNGSCIYLIPNYFQIYNRRCFLCIDKWDLLVHLINQQFDVQFQTHGFALYLQTWNLSRTHKHSPCKFLHPLGKIKVWTYAVSYKFTSFCND